VICDQRLVEMDDDERVALSSSLTVPCLIRQSELLAMAGPAQSVRMQKVQNLHLLPIAQENSRSSDGLLPSMSGQKNGSSSADTGPAFVLALTMKTFPLTSTSVLAI
jgi:hypothetical protein